VEPEGRRREAPARLGRAVVVVERAFAAHLRGHNGSHDNDNPARAASRRLANDESEARVGIIAFLILGLLAGAIAKAISPGDDPGGFIITMALGVVGALLGGFIAGALFDADPLDEFFDISTWVTAIVGSLIVLTAYRMLTKGGGRSHKGVLR
jgi:uncharacterized membrane protein YeaQ/YmgE (transglycosylase-associated protein family)